MICERLKELVPEYLFGAIGEDARIRMLAHLDGCGL